MKRAASLAICLAAGAFLPQIALADMLPMRVHGVVKAFDGQYLTITADSGKTVVLGMQPTTRILRCIAMTLADLRPGYFVGTVATKGADGVLHAQSIRIFPPSSVGSGEGQYPSDSNPTRTVTNGAVAAVAVGPVAGTLSLTFHGADNTSPCAGHAVIGGIGCVGSANIQVARGVPIAQVTTGDNSMLLSGAIVSALATTDAASLFTATSITIEKDGKPQSAVAQ